MCQCVALETAAMCSLSQARAIDLVTNRILQLLDQGFKILSKYYLKYRTMFKVF